MIKKKYIYIFRSRSRQFEKFLLSPPKNENIENAIIRLRERLIDLFYRSQKKEKRKKHRKNVGADEDGGSFLRMAMSWPRVLQNGLEGSWPSKRSSTGSFARNKYVWPRFWPEKHYV